MSIAPEADRSLQNRSILGIFLMILGLALYPLSDALIKHLTGTYSVPQTTFLRAVTRLVPLFIATFFHGGPRHVLSMKHPSRHVVRLAVNLAYTYAFMFSFSLASLTTIYTLSYTSPLFMIILGAVMLKEKVSLDRWIAVGIGLLGVLIARSSSNVLEAAALLVLFGTFLGALNKILMRRLAATEHSLAIAIYPNVVLILATLPVLFFITPWQSMPLAHWGLFAIVGVLTAGAQYAIAQALRYTQASVLAPIDYSTFFWVVALDFAWWHKSPDLCTIIGAVVIVGSNFYILFKARKEQLAKKAVAAGS